MPLPLIAAGALLLAKTFAPAVVSHLAGPRAGDVAEKIVGIASDLTGQADPILALQLLQDNPEMLTQFEHRMAEIDLEEQRIHAEDRKGARGMATRLAELGHAAAGAPVIVSAIVAAGFMGTLWFSLSKQIPTGNERMTDMLTGALIVAFTQVVNFWMGSSKSSQDKTGLISRLTGGAS